MKTYSLDTLHTKVKEEDKHSKAKMMSDESEVDIEQIFKDGAMYGQWSMSSDRSDFHKKFRGKTVDQLWTMYID